LDLSAAFDTVDYDVLLQRQQKSFWIGEIALNWFRSYLSDRTQYVSRGSVRSSAAHLAFGVPQGSIVGQILFILYIADFAALI
jgi:ribonuclease P/MRP protein subunit RPP40